MEDIYSQLNWLYLHSTLTYAYLSVLYVCITRITTQSRDNDSWTSSTGISTYKVFEDHLLDNQTVKLLSFHNLQYPEMPTNLPVPILHDSYNSPDALLM